jgi:hypothetical protein
MHYEYVFYSHAVTGKADYSTENPPPKVVQGYKFNVFYPDLM